MENIRNDNSEINTKQNMQNSLYPVLFDNCDEFMGEIATKVWATSKWVFQRNANLDTNKEVEEAEYLKTIDELQGKYENSTIENVLKDVNEALAQLFWYFNRKPENQTKEERDDDYHDAKRYLGFLFADMILDQCVHGNCPNKFLQQEYIEYLQSISVEEFLKHKAYLKWHERNQHKYIKDSDKEVSDYLDSVGKLDKTMTNCKGKKCFENIRDWSCIFGDGDFVTDTTILRAITKAKTNAINRMSNQKEAQILNKDTERFVITFYPQVFGWLVNGRKPNHGKTNEIIGSIYGKSKITNMFEFLLKCSLLCHLKEDEHLESRKRYNKGPLVTISEKKVT